MSESNLRMRHARERWRDEVGGCWWVCLWKVVGGEHIFICLSGLQGVNARAIIGQGIAMATAEVGSREKGFVLSTMWRNELVKEKKPIYAEWPVSSLVSFKGSIKISFLFIVKYSWQSVLSHTSMNTCYFCPTFYIAEEIWSQIQSIPCRGLVTIQITTRSIYQAVLF